MGESAVKIAQQVYAYLKRYKVLLVFDGVEELEHADLLVDLFGKRSHSSKIVMTSRVIPTGKSWVAKYDLPDLSQKETEGLLHAHTTNLGLADEERLAPALITQIYEAFGGHPMVLQALPNLLQDEPFLDLLRGVQKGKTISLDYIYGVIWQRLSPAAQMILGQLCFVSRAGVARDYFRETYTYEPLDLSDALSELRQYVLVQAQKVGSDRFLYSLHNLTKQFVLRKRPESLPDTADAAVAYWQQRVTQAEPSTWEGLDREWRNSLATFKFCQALRLPVENQHARAQLLLNLHPFIENRRLGSVWEPIYADLIDYSDTSIVQCQLFRVYGVILYGLGQREKAISIYLHAKQLAQQLNSESNRARVLHNLAQGYVQKRQYHLANEYILESIETFHELDMLQEEMALALMLRGVIAERQGAWKLASDLYKEVATISKEHHLTQTYVQAMRNLGNIACSQDDLPLAHMMYRQAYHVLSQHSDPIAYSRLQLSECYMEISVNNFDQAEAILLQMDTEWLEEKGVIDILGTIYANLGYISLQKKAWAEGIKYATQSLNYWNDLGNRYECANSLDTLADIHREIGDTGIAQKQYSRALSILQEMNSLDYLSKKLSDDINIKMESLEVN